MALQAPAASGSSSGTVRVVSCWVRKEGAAVTIGHVVLCKVLTYESIFLSFGRFVVMVIRFVVIVHNCMHAVHTVLTVLHWYICCTKYQVV